MNDNEVNHVHQVSTISCDGPENIVGLGMNTCDPEPKLSLIRCAVLIKSLKPADPDLLVLKWEQCTNLFSEYLLSLIF
jgi:hypothetical protein